MRECNHREAITNGIIEYISENYTTEQLIECIDSREFAEELRRSPGVGCIVLDECIAEAIGFCREGLTEDALADANGMSVEEYRRNKGASVMPRFKSVDPEYTGGGVYVFTGQLDDDTYFMADTSFYDVCILDADPNIPDDMPDDEAQRIYGVTRDEDAWASVEWQESHFVKALEPDEAVRFFKSMFRWIRDNEPDGNYNCADLKYYEDELKTLKGNWR